ncbi:MAG: winged helix-turn-helix transcriptional regulator [Spirochaetales bacterium]|nr:winged helix-turn-helix transcriptional regulator [Spirochaetales bacterium]
MSNITIHAKEKELEILEHIYANEREVRQRDIAEIVGLSLGMTNSILKRLAQKGLLTIRKVNNRNIQYAVSPRGIEEITKRSYQYFKRTIKNVVFYREEIESLVKRIKKEGFAHLMLIGVSDLGFIVEHACSKYQIELVIDDDNTPENCYQLYSESYIYDTEARELGRIKNIDFLSRFLMDTHLQ